jgi:hypothetical protein
MAAPAVEGTPRFLGIFTFFVPGWRSVVSVLGAVRMALEADFDGLIVKQCHFVGRVGRVAGRAVTGSHRRMNILLGEAGFIVAGKT